VFPKKEHLNIGIGCIGLKNEETNSKINLKNHYNEYITFLKENKQIPEELEHVPLKGGALPIFPLEKTYGNRTILIGDAGGFINPLSGEGIYYAMASGEIAAQVIAEALEKGKTDEKFLSKFQARWKKEFGKDLELIFKIHRKQHKRSGEKLFEVSGKDKILAGLIMGVITGELSIRKNKWKIVRRYFYASIKGKIKK
jgi:flavin-dependent dehydrogenase